MKTYIIPEIIIVDIKINELLQIAIGSGDADKDYDGGGDAKSRVVDFSSDDNSFDF